MKPNPEDDPCIERYGVTPAYRRMMNIPLVAGRDLLESDTATAQQVVLISQATAREVFGADNPIGAQVRMGSADRGAWRTIVGVVGDVHHADVTVPVTPAMYVPEEQFTDSFLVAVTILFALLGVGLVALRHSNYGRRLNALKAVNKL